MKQFKILLTSLVLFSFFGSVYSQVGIGTTTPQGALDITSTDDGLVIPRVALDGTNQAAPLTTPVNSEMVYNTNNNTILGFPAPVLANLGPITPGFYFWNTSISKWERFVTGTPTTPAGWLTTGNTGLNAATNFIGTTDAIDVAFRRNNAAAGRIGSTSTSFGVSALAVNTGNNNTAFGVNALAVNNTKADNTAIGYNALAAHGASTTGDGTKNTALGSEALRSVTGGTLNTAVGYDALRSLGGLAENNTAVGASALRNASAAATRDNVAVGNNAMGSTGATITQSVAVGASALISASNNTTRNTAIGHSAGSNITSGNDNIVIGANAQVSSPTGSSQIVIGAGTAGTAYVNAPSWSFSSDRRLKADIKDSPLGLDYIKTIRPVSYYRTDDINQKTEFGFIAQELETSLNSAGITNSGILMTTANGMYAVRYNDFLPIAIKAIQEQQEQIEELKQINAALQKANEDILKRLEALEKK